jgi:DNA modification methylase
VTFNIEWWDIDKVIPYAKNARKIRQAAIDKVAASIAEFGWRQPIVVDAKGVIAVGHVRWGAANKLKLEKVPVHVASDLTDAQIKAYRLMDNRSNEETDWDFDLLGPELADLKMSDFDLALTGFDPNEIDAFLLGPVDEHADDVPPVPLVPVSRLGDVWLCGPHRVICGDCTSPEVIARLLGDRKPILMVTDPPYGIELDMEWRDRAGLNGTPGSKRTAMSKAIAKMNPLAPAEPSYMREPTNTRAAPKIRKKVGKAEPSYMKHRGEGYTETSISGDTIADWSAAFELVPSLQVAYVWHASIHTTEVLAGLLRIGFLYPQQIIWDKGRAVLTRTHYWFQHEPCWYVRKKNAPWYGKPGGENTSIWSSPSPKFIMGGSDEQKFDHPTQKPVALMRHSILNHTKRGELVYEPFLGSGTTLAAAELTERACCGVELEPKYVDVVVQRWQTLSGKEATLEGHGATFEHVKHGRQAEKEDHDKDDALRILEERAAVAAT